VKFLLLLVFAVSMPLRSWSAESGWMLVRSPHFQVYSQLGERDGRSVALTLEQLRTFFVGGGAFGLRVAPEDDVPVRAIQFAAIADYAPFRPRASADAFFLSSESANYIVLAPAGQSRARTLAHEYAHLVLRSAGMRLPPWFAEGIAEVLSSVEITPRESLIGGDILARSQTLEKHGLLPLQQLLTLAEDDPSRANRDDAEIFYAESWELTHMLLFSPQYRSKADLLWAAFKTGTVGAPALAAIYGRTIETIESDFQGWMRKSKCAVPLPGITAHDQVLRTSGVQQRDLDLVLAGLVLASGDLDRAETVYRNLQTRSTSDPTVASTLGFLALRRHDDVKALLEWKQAFDLGTKDPVLCFQYANLLQNAHAPEDQIAAALERAIQSNSRYDDARFQLALLENGRENYAAALEQLRAMRPVAPARAYTYWLAMGSALLGTGQRPAAKVAAEKAASFAVTTDQRDAAALFALDTETDVTVQMAHDSQGNLRVVTSRKPHGATDWNPFVEVGDQIRTVTGRIHKVACSNGAITGFEIETGSGIVRVSLSDPAHVLIDGGKPEFFCEAEDGREVTVQFAVQADNSRADGVLRGMHFAPTVYAGTK
jgi:hypothetical protein